MPMALAGVLVGFVGPKVGWGRWTTYLVGALFAALIVPLVAGSLLRDDAGLPYAIGEWYHATAASAASADHRPRGQEPAVHDPGRPLPRWSSASSSGRPRVRLVRGVRPPPAAQRDRRARHRPARDTCRSRSTTQLPYLVVFTRRRAVPADPRCTRSTSGRRGSAAGSATRPRSRASTCAAGPCSSSVAVLGSLLLDATRRVGPLAGAWTGSAHPLVELGRSGRVPAGGRQHDLVRGRLRPVGTRSAACWNPSTTRGDDDHAAGRTRRRTSTGARSPTTSSPERLGAARRRTSVDPARRRPRPRRLERRRRRGRPQGPDLHGHAAAGCDGRLVFSPLTRRPASTRRRSVGLTGDGAYLNAIERLGDGPYTVDALVPVAGEDPGELSQSACRPPAPELSPGHPRPVHCSPGRGDRPAATRALLDEPQGRRRRRRTRSTSRST